MKSGSNLCFFNQALQLLLHYKEIFQWINKTSPSQIKSKILINFYFIGLEYYSYAERPNIINLNVAYNTLVQIYLNQKHMQIGSMDDLLDAYDYILNEFKFEKSFYGQNYSSLFEVGYKRIEYYKDNENTSTLRSSILNLSTNVSIANITNEQTNIKLPDVKDKEKNNNFQQWIKLNMMQKNQSQCIPNNQRSINSISEAIKGFVFAKSKQMEI